MRSIKKIIRFRIATILVLTAIVALICSAMQPFHPKVALRIEKTAYYVDENGQRNPTATVTIINEGTLPLWFRGTSYERNRIHDYWVGCDTTPSNQSATHCSTSLSSWNAFWPGESTVIVLNSSGSNNAFVGFTIKDWRGRKRFGRTEQFDLHSQGDHVDCNWTSGEFWLWQPLSTNEQ